MSEVDPVTVWLEELQDATDSAAEKLWHHFMSRLYESARKGMSPGMRRVYDEEDAAQSAFNSVCIGIKAGRFPDLHDRSCLWRLLLRVTALKVAQRHRFDRQQRRDIRRTVTEAVFANPEESTLGPIVNQLPCREPSPVFTAQFVEVCDLLFHCLDDPKLKEVARLRMEGYTDREIGEQLSCSRRTVQRRVEAIRRQCLELM